MRARWGMFAALVLAVAACSSGAGGFTEASAPSTVAEDGHDHAERVGSGREHHPGRGATTREPSPRAVAADIGAAALATAAFQDVSAAEAAGYGSTLGDLGCFEDDAFGGMGLHYLNADLLDDVVDITAPEALVYELGAGGEIVGLVAHEYIVPVDAWTEDAPPNLFGVDFHQHPVLPLWVLHAWIWKDNPWGFFEDWNPKVRMCPEGVPVFGVDLP